MGVDYSAQNIPEPVEANVPTLYNGMGNVNLTTDRSQEARVPWAGALTPPLRKLTHFRAPGLGAPMWSGQCVYDIPGVSESISEYDEPDVYASDDDLTYSITGGVVKSSDQLEVGEYTTTRRSRVAAHFDSAPAARHFQGYFNAHWSGMFVGMARPTITPRPLTQNFNPNQMGSKELHKATQYKPVPPMGSIVSFYGTGEKAL
jgi:hypothetical protein